MGFSIAQLIWGPISDKIGRKKPLIIGMILFTIGSIGCAMSQSIAQIVFWRAFQAVGACTAPMLARAIVRDLYERTKAAQMLSTLVVIMAIAPVVGPLLGGLIIKFSTWHAIFWLLATIGAVMLVALKFMPETLNSQNRLDVGILQAFGNYKILLSNAGFMRYALCLTFYYVALYAFIVGSPAVYIEFYAIAQENYGWLFALNIIGVMSLSLVNRSLVKRFSLNALLGVALFIATLGALTLIALVSLHVGGLYAVAACVFFIFSMNGVIGSCCIAAALDKVPHIAGSGSALIGSLQYGSGIVSSWLFTLIKDGTPFSMAIIISTFTILSALIMLLTPKNS